MSSNSFQVTFNFPTDAAIASKLDLVGQMKRHHAQDNMSRAMGRIIVARALKLVPRADRNPKGNPHNKRASKQAGSANWRYPIWKTLKWVLRTTNTGAYVIVGPTWPDGNKIHFLTMRRKVAEGNGSSRVVYWGNDPKNGPMQRLAVRNFLVQAADETEAEQKAAALAAIEKFLKDWVSSNV
jgi:hypothetical protein